MTRDHAESTGRAGRPGDAADQVEPQMRRTTPIDDDAQPVMVPRNDRALASISQDRVRRLRKHLVRLLRTMKDVQRSASSTRPEPPGFAARVAQTACSLCKGFCCGNGADDAFLDEATLQRARHGNPTLNARELLRLYVERVPTVGYDGSCIFHGKQGCTLDRSLRSDVCNAYFCGGLHAYVRGSDPAVPTVVIAGEGDEMRTSAVLRP
jgi:hypothetical protein